MKKRSLLTSVAASTVLAGVLMLSGCGGSSTGKAKDNVNKVNISEGTSSEFTAAVSQDIEFPVIGKDSNGITVETASIKISHASDLSECTTSSRCRVVAVQKCPTELSQTQLDEANTLAPSVPDIDDKIVLYAGTIDISEVNGKLTNCGMEVTVKLPKSAYSSKPFSVDGVEQTFKTSDGHFITAIEKCDVMKIYVKGQGWVTGYITNPGCNADKYVTFTVPGLPAEIFVYALRHFVPGHTTGVTGSTGGSGY